MWHTHTHTHQNELSPIPHGHTLRCPRSIPSSSCVALAPFSCTTTSLLRCTSRHTWPSLLSPAAHPVTSDGLSPLQPHVPLPPIPPRPPRYQQGNLVLQPGDCCLFILQCLCIKWWGGGFLCVSVCMRAPHKRVCVRALSLSHDCMHRRMWAHSAHAYTRKNHTAVHVNAGKRRRSPDSL